MKEKKVKVKPEKVKKVREKKQKESVTNKKIGFFSRIGFKIILLSVVAVLVACAVLLVISVSKSKKIIIDYTENNMTSLADAYGKYINDRVSQSVVGEDVIYKQSMEGVKIIGLETSYSYVVSDGGVIAYHPDESLIGTMDTNPRVIEIYEKLANREKPKTECIRLEFDGSTKFVSYFLLKNHGLVVFVAEESEVTKSVSTISGSLMRIGLLIAILAALFAYYVGTLISKPIKDIALIVEKTSEFDFTSDKKSARLEKRKDECGLIAKAVKEMRIALSGIVGDIEHVSGQISENIGELTGIGSDINTICVDNSATTEELAASMQETSATAETIGSSVDEMRDAANDIRQKSIQGEELAKEIMSRAVDMKTTTESARERTQGMYKDVKAKTEIAIEDSKAVNKINELTDAIMAISSQTSLLALNASIEAARAGDAGRGFAVVATEIGNLANQTSTTVKDINDIVEEVNKAVVKMTESLQETINFLENIVIQDYDQFADVSEQYNTDADTVSNSMTAIEKEIGDLTQTILRISEAVDGIIHTVGEAANGVTDIADKNCSVVEKTGKNTELVYDFSEHVEKLKKIEAMFTIEK